MSRTLQTLLALFLSASLVACGLLKTTYNNADTLIYWWLDGYVDFTIEQKPKVQDELLAFQQWHRKTQLPIYVGLVKQLQEQVKTDVTPAQLCSNWQIALDQIPALTNYLEPQVLWVVTQLSDEQIQSIDAKYNKANQEWRKDWQPPALRDMHRHYVKTVRERLETLYGSLDEAQVRQLRESVIQSPFDATLAYAERQRRQRDMVSTLKDIRSKRMDADAAREPLRALLQRNLVSPNAEFRAYSERVRLSSCTMFAKMHNGMTSEQRAHALNKLKDYERDFVTLMQRNK